jgi:hypothetical protein
MENKNYAIVCHVSCLQNQISRTHSYLCDNSKNGQQWEVWRQEGHASLMELQQ